MKSPLLCRMGLHKLNKYTYVQVTRRRSNRHGGKYHTNYAICERCGKLCYRVRRFQKLGVARIAGSAGGRRQGMSKAVLISIRPMWYQKIMSGQKTIEVRKTRPKMNPPFKCYIYKCGNGKVIGEFLCDQIININGAGRIPSDAARPTCLEPAELHQYLGAATGFGWHISNLRIYDTPRELREFYAVPNEVEVALKAKPKPITRPPQSWRYVEEELWSD